MHEREPAHQQVDADHRAHEGRDGPGHGELFVRGGGPHADFPARKIHGVHGHPRAGHGHGLGEAVEGVVGGQELEVPHVRPDDPQLLVGGAVGFFEDDVVFFGPQAQGVFVSADAEVALYGGPAGQFPRQGGVLPFGAVEREGELLRRTMPPLVGTTADFDRAAEPPMPAAAEAQANGSEARGQKGVASLV